MTGFEQAAVWIIGIMLLGLNVGNLVDKIAEVRKARWTYKHEVQKTNEKL